MSLELPPVGQIQILNTRGENVLLFPPTSRLYEAQFRKGSLHLRHTKETTWPPVMLETAEQQATLWVCAEIGGKYVAAGMERLRPNQQEKPEGDDPAGFIAGFVEGRDFGPFNGHQFQRGDTIWLWLVAGDSRLNNNFAVRERTDVVALAFPCDGAILWREGEPVTGETETDGGGTGGGTDTGSGGGVPADAIVAELRLMREEFNLMRMGLLELTGELVTIRDHQREGLVGKVAPINLGFVKVPGFTVRLTPPEVK